MKQQNPGKVSIWARLAGTALIALCVLTIAGGMGQQRSHLDGRSKPFFTRKNLYFVMPAVPLDSVGISRTVWTADGQHLFVHRFMAAHTSITLDDAIADLNGKHNGEDYGGSSLESYDVATGKTRSLWQGEGIEVVDIQPLGAHEMIISLVRNLETRPNVNPLPAMSAMVIDVKTGRWKVLPQYQDLHGSIDINAAPVGATALLTYTPDPNWGKAPPQSDAAAATTGGAEVAIAAAAPVAIAAGTPTPDVAPSNNVVLVVEGAFSSHVDQDGNTLKNWPVALELSPVNWSNDGKLFYWFQHNRKAKTTTYFTISDDAKPLKLESTPVAWTPPAQDIEVQPLVVAFSAADRNRFGNVSGLFLHAVGRLHGKDVLVSAGGRNPDMSPTNDAIAFEVDHQLKVSRLLKLDPNMLSQVKGALKTRAINDAKQAALGLIMYAGDSDDLLPQSSMFPDSVDPYVRNMDILGAFSYTPPGGLNLTQLSNPATTMIGYVDGPGGRAIAYADGHVAWSDDSDSE